MRAEKEKAAHAWQGDGAAETGNHHDHSGRAVARNLHDDPGADVDAGPYVRRKPAADPAAAAVTVGRQGAEGQTPALYHGGQNHNIRETSEPGPLLSDADLWAGGPIEADEIGIDWASFVGEVWGYEAVRRLCLEVFGEPEKLGPGHHGYELREVYRFGVGLQRGHGAASSFWHLQLPGEACMSIGPRRTWEFCQRAFLGSRCTRFDLRRDLHGQRLNVIDQCLASCEAGELCHVRRYRPEVERDAKTHELHGHGVYLGSRRSERFVRFYDKGLERGGPEAGTWLRWEAQLRDHFAHEAAYAVLSSSPEAWAAAAGSYLVGVVDFKQVTGDRNLERRPRSPWWARFLEGFDSARTDARPRMVTLESRVAWLQAAVMPFLAETAHRAGTTPGGVLEALCGRPAVDVGEHPEEVIRQAVAYMNRHHQPEFFI